MANSSRPTFTFFLLVVLAAAASYGALLLTTQLSGNDDIDTMAVSRANHKPSQSPLLEIPKPTAAELDTSTWKDYVDHTYFLSFKYPSTWEVQTYPNQAGYYIIVLKPNNAADHVRIYISPDNYFAMSGLPTKKDTLGGAKGINLNNVLVGVKYAAQYYTFDMGTDPVIQPQFQELLGTVAFSK